MADLLAQRVAERIHLQMRRQRATQDALAKHLGISQAGISRRLTGQVEFTVGELAAVAQFLGVSVHDLLPEAVA